MVGLGVRIAALIAAYALRAAGFGSCIYDDTFGKRNADETSTLRGFHVFISGRDPQCRACDEGPQT